MLRRLRSWRSNAPLVTSESEADYNSCAATQRALGALYVMQATGSGERYDEYGGCGYGIR